MSFVDDSSLGYDSFDLNLDLCNDPGPENHLTVSSCDFDEVFELLNRDGFHPESIFENQSISASDNSSDYPCDGFIVSETRRSDNIERENKLILSEHPDDRHIRASSHPESRIPRSRFDRHGFALQRFVSEFINGFNERDVMAVSSLISRYMHHRCLFRVLDNIHGIQEKIGSDMVTLFFASMIAVYPDATIRCKGSDIKIFPHERFQVIQVKVTFSGTEIAWQAGKQLLCNESSGMIVDYVSSNASPEEKERYIALEDEIKSHGKRRQIKMKGIVTVYFDPDIVKGVLGDIQFKVVHLQPS